MVGHASSTAWLESDRGERTVLVGTSFLGRASASTLVLASETVSRRHAIVHSQDQNEYWLVDLGSANGTLLNGRRVMQPSRLADGDEIRIGEYTLTFHQPSEASGEGSMVGEQTQLKIRADDCWLVVADIEGFTRIIQAVGLEEVPRITRRWVADCKQIIDLHGGTIDAYIGDGLLAYWTGGDAAAAPVAAALDDLRRRQAAEDPRFRVVVHFGRVTMGGSPTTSGNHLLGREVNFVFRMEKVASSLGLPRLMSSPAQARMGSMIPGTEAGRHVLDGFDGDFLLYSF